MRNHFARFRFEPRPWLDQDLLKTRFLELSTQAHPDKASADQKSNSEDDFQMLNEGYHTLRHTRSRLLHLLEISGVPRQEHVQNVPADALEFFTAVAAATKQADNLIKEKAAAHSPMLKVQLMDRTLEQIDALQALQEKLRQRVAAIEERMRAASHGWASPPNPACIALLAQSAAALGFFERWLAQLQDRIGALTF